MTTLFKSLKDVCTSTHRKYFRYSLLATSTWFSAILLALFSDLVPLEYLNYWITGLLIASVVFSVNAMPYQAARQSLTKAQVSSITASHSRAQPGS